MRKYFISLCLIMLFACCTRQTQPEGPVSGSTFSVIYDISEQNIFEAGDSIYIVYVFDFWGTKYNLHQGAEALFKNILEPDPGRIHKTLMEKQNRLLSVKIDIPPDASLLSYYFTDGAKNDYNEKKTYTHFVLSSDGQPVKGARFRYLDFLLMAGAGDAEQLQAITEEISLYPKFYQAYIPYWRYRFNMAPSFDDLLALRTEFEEQFNALQSKYGESDSLLVARASVYYSYLPAIFKFAQEERENTNGILMNLIEEIPEAKRTPALTGYFDGMKRMEAMRAGRDEMLGKTAVNFTFTSLKGDKYELADFKGKYVLLDFWGTWCKPCLAELPYLSKAYNKFTDKGLVMISISSDIMVSQSKTIAEVKDFCQEHAMLWINTIDEKDHPIHELYQVNSWPSTFLLDKSGKIMASGSKLRGEQLLNTLQPLLN